MSSQDVQEKQDQLSSLMVGALEGDQLSIESFFLTLLDSKLHIPKKEQPIILRDLVDFPNQLVDFLAFRSGERVLVPVFSTIDKLREWGGEQIHSRDVSFKHLLEILPDECWVVINPSNDIEKEISPWELSQLKGGGDGIPAILKEMRDDQPLEDISYSTVAGDEYLGLKNCLVELGDQTPEILEIYILKQSGRDSIGTPSSQALIGIKVASTEEATISRIEDMVRSHIDPIQIGGDRAEVYVGSNVEGSILLHLFSNVTPLYVAENKTNQNSFWNNFKRYFS